MKNSKNKDEQSSLANYMTLFFTIIFTMLILDKTGFKYSVFSDDFDFTKLVVLLVTSFVVFNICYLFFNWLFPNDTKNK